MGHFLLDNKNLMGFSELEKKYSKCKITKMYYVAKLIGHKIDDAKI